MKLTPENIAAIEACLTRYEDGESNRGLMIEYGFSEITHIAPFLSVLRSLGIRVSRSGVSKLSRRDHAAFVEFLRQKRSEKERDAQAQSNGSAA